MLKSSGFIGMRGASVPFIGLGSDIALKRTAAEVVMLLMCLIIR